MNLAMGGDTGLGYAPGNAKGRSPKTPAQRLTGDAFRGTPPVSAISPKKSLRTALRMGRS